MTGSLKQKRLTVPKVRHMKSEGKPIVMLTAYDFAFARYFDRAGIDCILVGDSLSMVVQGHDDTLSATLDMMIYHGEMVVRASQRALVVVDMPFATYHLGVHRTIENAARVIRESRCQAVKLEGGVDIAPDIRGLVSAGIPVMGHVGLRPQQVNNLGGYAVQRDEQAIFEDARAVEQAGAFSIVLECIPRKIAAAVTAELSIPTIGIGAGPSCDGQVLVMHDMLGMADGNVPKHARNYADLSSSITKAAESYVRDVRSGEFPSDAQSFE